MTTHRWHHPLPGTRDGARATCGGCGVPIVHVEALDNRAAYWRVTTVKVEAVDILPHDEHERPERDCPKCEAEMCAQYRAYRDVPGYQL